MDKGSIDIVSANSLQFSLKEEVFSALLKVKTKHTNFLKVYIYLILLYNKLDSR